MSVSLRSLAWAVECLLGMTVGAAVRSANFETNDLYDDWMTISKGQIITYFYVLF